MNSQSVQLDKGIFCFVFYCTAVMLTDSLRLLLPFGFGLTVLLAWGILGAACFYWRKSFCWRRVSVGVWDLFPLGILLLAFLSRVYLPDQAVDTRNYHLYIQQMFPVSQVAESFFPSTVYSTFTLPLADRLSYLFREILGYRMGSVFNTMVAVLLYFQARQLIADLFAGETRLRRPFFAAAAGAVVLGRECFFQQAAYLTDLRLLPILLFLTGVFLHSPRWSAGRWPLFFLFYLGGLEVALKLSSASVVIFLLLGIVIRAGWRWNISFWMMGLGFFLFPLLGYLYVVYAQTGNPLYPYANGIFSSPFFPVGMDNGKVLGLSGQGPHGWGECVLWPMYAVLFPERINAAPLFSVLPLVIVAAGAGSLFLRKRPQSIRYLLFFMMFLYVLWVTVCYGYIRYILILEFLGMVLVCWYIGQSVLQGGWQRFAGGVLSVFVLGQFLFLGYSFFVQGVEYSVRRPVYTAGNRLAENCRMLFRDRNASAGEIPEVKSWLVLPPDAGYMSLLKQDVPMVGYAGFYQMFHLSVLTDAARDSYEQALHRNLGHGMYTMLTTFDGSGDEICRNMSQLLADGIIVRGVKPIQPSFLPAGTFMNLAEVSPAERQMDFWGFALDAERSLQANPEDDGRIAGLSGFAVFVPGAVGRCPEDGAFVEVWDRQSNVLLVRQWVPADGSMTAFQLSLPAKTAARQLSIKKVSEGAAAAQGELWVFGYRME